MVDKYKFSSGTTKLQGVEKKRQEIKERIFTSLLYGIEELKGLLD